MINNLNTLQKILAYFYFKDTEFKKCFIFKFRYLIFKIFFYIEID